MGSVSTSWQETAKLAQKARDESLAAVQPSIPDVPAELPLNVAHVPKELLSKSEIEITESLPEDLLSSLAAGKLTSTEVTNAFLRRAGLVQKLTNCVTELLPAAALARAKYLDEHFAEHNKPVGPLHGLPISVKEHIGMKGLGLNGGFISWWDRKGDVDAHILQLLWSAGAVFYARTTQPQTLMHLETSNNLYGETVCGFNRGLTSGGSSGGEGSLIGMRGSCLGIGTDIGGSIRSPAANNGVYGLRPSSKRLPMAGLTATMKGQEHIIPVIGPLSTSLEGVKIFMKTLIDQQPWMADPALLPFAWRDDVKHFTRTSGKRKTLKIAVIWHDDVVKPHPPVIRALREVTEKLKGVPGVEIVDWKPYKHDYAWDIISSLYFADGAKQEKEAIEASGEPWRPLSHFIITEQPFCKEMSIGEMWAWTLKRDDYRSDYGKLWNSTATVAGDPESMVDVILCPVGPGAAPPLNHARYWGYTSQWNLLDYPSLVFPVTKVDQEKDLAEQGYKPMNAQDEWNYKLYTPEKYADAPVSLQLVGRRYEDEKVIDALEFIKDAVGLPFVSYL